MATLHIWVDLVLRSGLDPWAVVKAWLFLNDWILLLFWFLDWVWDICLQTCYIYWNPFTPSVPAIFPAVGCHIQHSVLLGLLCWTLGDMIFLFSPNVMYHQLLWMQNHRSSLSSSSYAFFTSTKTQWSSFVLYINTLKANNTSVVLKHEAILHLTDHQLSSSTKLQQPVTPQRLRSLPVYPLSIKNHSLFSDIQGF